MCAYNPGVQDIRGQLIAQGIGQAAQGFGQAIQAFAQNTAMSRQAVGKFHGAVQANPQMLKLFESGQAPKDVQAAYDKLKNSGNLAPKDAGMLSLFTDSYQEQAKQQAQQQMMQQQMQAQQMQMEEARRRMAAEASQRNLFENIMRGAGSGVMRPDLKNNPFVRQAAEYYQATGQVVPPEALMANNTRMAVQDAKNSAAAEIAELKSKVASAPQKYQTGSPLVDKAGKFIGWPVFDQTTGEHKLKGADGTWRPVPADAEPATPTAIQRNIPGQVEFRKLKDAVTESERSLRAMDRYMQSVDNASVGYQRLADTWTKNFKTYFDKGKLTQEELSAAMAKGQLQGLLGANRLQVVGGGVLTEQDALRVISRLGGDAGALQNPEVVRRAIAELYADRYQQYDDDLNFYNAAVRDFYGERGFKEQPKVPFNAKLSEVEAPGSVTSVGAAWSEDKEKRLRELQAKLGK